MKERSYGSPRHELRELIAQLEMKSQVSAAQVGRSVRATDDDIGGKRPSGGIDYKDDREPDSVLKSADYFRRKQARCYVDQHFEEVIVEINAVLVAWQRMPLPTGQPPTPGDPQWKRWVAESTMDVGELARLFNMPRQYIHRIRRDYGKKAA